ncbi:hypothetical protein FQN54_006636 [Arachnomyces sp. PD_36]|nr:hypothetical protein FQN54_006636 [Arachnomyces sp. PD_36]
MEGCTDANSIDERPTVIVKGPHDEEKSDHKQHLLSQLEKIPKNAPKLLIDKDTPSDTEWAILGEHFSHVNDLHLSTGWNEELNDQLMPSNWPLERLTLDSASGELTQTPFILEGKVKRLSLFLTSGLRFEGPTSEEFRGLYKEAVENGDIEAKYITVDEGKPEERKIELVTLPEIIYKWMKDKYTNPEPEAQPQTYTAEDINLRTLEILENDAMDTFTRLTLARAHLSLALDTLSIRSTHGNDFHFTCEDLFSQILPQLVGLQKLILAVGEISEDESFLPSFYKLFPPNLSTLRFRGPVSLAKSDQWPEWIKSFENPDYLPNLKTLSFVLDLNYETKPDETRNKDVAASEEVLREAKTACNQLYAAAEKRGIKVEPFYDEWAERCKIFRQVDERWEKL